MLWLHLIFLTIIPFSILLLLNCIIHRKLWEVTLIKGENYHSFLIYKGFVSVRRTNHKSLRKREVRMARVSLAIVFIFLICHSPKIVPTVCEIVYRDAKVSLM